jgi:hypothetical protein
MVEYYKKSDDVSIKDGSHWLPFFLKTGGRLFGIPGILYFIRFDF